MAHPLKQGLDELTKQDLDDLESILGVILKAAEDRLKWLDAAERSSATTAEELEDFESRRWITARRVEILTKLLSKGPFPVRPR